MILNSNGPSRPPQITDVFISGLFIFKYQIQPIKGYLWTVNKKSGQTKVGQLWLQQSRISRTKTLKIVNIKRFPQPCQWNPEGLCSWILTGSLQYPKRQLRGQPQLLQPRTIFQNSPCLPKSSITLSQRSVHTL